MKNTFSIYDSLQSSLEDVPKYDVLVILGDCNVRVGSDNTDREGIMGKHTAGTMTDRQRRDHGKTWSRHDDRQAEKGSWENMEQAR